MAREKTERTETIDIGLGRLVGTTIGAFVPWARIAPPPLSESPYGDGNAAGKIIAILAGEEKHGADT